MLVVFRGMNEAALLVSGIPRPEQILHIAETTSILRGSPLSRPRSLMPTAMAPRVASGAIGVELRVSVLLQRQPQQKDRQVLVGEGPCLALRCSATLIRGIFATNQKSISLLPYDPGVSRPTQWSKTASSSEIRAGLGLFGDMDLVMTCLTSFSKYLVLQHCNSRSHFPHPLALVWPVILRNRQKL